VSGKPSPAGDTRAIALIDRIQSLDVEIVELRRLTARLQIVEEQRGAVGRDLVEHLSSMDVDSPENHGWEHRVAWLLSEVIRQARGGAP
jgi:hypothetical protein